MTADKYYSILGAIVFIPIILGGIVLAGYLLRKFINSRAKRYYNKSKTEKNIFLGFSFMGAAISVGPAALLSLAVGGMLGGGWGVQFGEAIGVGLLGLILGLVAGPTIFILAVVSTGVYLSSLLGEIIILIRRKLKGNITIGSTADRD